LSADPEAQTEEFAVLPPVPELPLSKRPLLVRLTGILAGGLVALAVAMIAAQVFSWAHGQPGPSVLVVLAHLLGAVLAVLAQRSADRLDGGRRLLAAWTVVAVFVLILSLLWWAWLWVFWSF
jgi:hypothetical protein